MGRGAICSDRALLRIIDRRDVVHRLKKKKKKKNVCGCVFSFGHRLYRNRCVSIWASLSFVKAPRVLAWLETPWGATL